MPREKAIVSTFHPGRSAVILSLRVAYCSSSYAPVVDYQFRSPSFGQVNSSI